MRKVWIHLLGACMVAALLLTACNSSSYGGSDVPGVASSPDNTGSNSGSSSGGAPNWGVQSKTSGCQAQGPLQDKACSPGAIFPNVTKTDICRSGYASSVRNVPTSEKNQVYQEYGITHHSTGEYEVDHLVSLELGGSNDISNLWPEAASPKPGFHEKDKVENYLHDQVCSGAISLKDAQIEIATNWLNVYNKMGGN
ncbi:hypothetical protein KSC_094850 [Ktedonobacter sp. SOSP1-52]|uniref:HNH endonuclease signature motif containing protein n=1 Tax=Ktedonobacter sp. SOSP1-52 TaxID=2778366 RepID=UPI0019159C81|nr:HNH endonuclease signature motif containing protein [Ktedonobacter sp. SOSP1-52]GHO70593.1 hypothetical protein KSC_094850 [Ktedonobacter sp. SOSP1-52]